MFERHEGIELTRTIETDRNDVTLRIEGLIPEGQELVSVKLDDELSYAVSLMKQNNYSQLPVVDECEKLKGVISWRIIGETITDSQTHQPKFVRECMDTDVRSVRFDTSLFEVMQEIEYHDYIVVEDSDSRVKGIVTANDLANRFERFSKAFAYIGEIDLMLRRLIEDKLNRPEAIECALKGKSPECEGTDEANPGLIKKPDFGKYVKILNSRPDILDLSDKNENIVYQVDKVRMIRNKVMHFKSGRLEEATDEDIRLLEVLLKKIRDI